VVGRAESTDGPTRPHGRDPSGICLFATCGGDDHDAAAAAEATHATCLASINSTDLDKFLLAVTEDIVCIAPNSAPLNGKAAVGEWVGGWLAAHPTVWEKESLEFVIEDDLADDLPLQVGPHAPRERPCRRHAGRHRHRQPHPHPPPRPRWQVARGPRRLGNGSPGRTVNRPGPQRATNASRAWRPR
jgi:hypothetical protein